MEIGCEITFVERAYYGMALVTWVEFAAFKHCLVINKFAEIAKILTCLVLVCDS